MPSNQFWCYNTSQDEKFNLGQFFCVEEEQVTFRVAFFSSLGTLGTSANTLKQHNSL